jgi:hypothetical protein
MLTKCPNGQRPYIVCQRIEPFARETAGANVVAYPVDDQRMRILLLPDNADPQGITVDVARIPMAGEFIMIENNGVEIWHRVQLVAMVPMGDIAAKVLTVWMSKAEARKYAERNEPEPSWKRQYELLTEEEAAAVAKVHPRTIRRRIDAGELPASNYGSGAKKIYRIKPGDLAVVQLSEPPPGPERRRRRYVPATSAAPWPPPAVGQQPVKRKKRDRVDTLTDEERAAKDKAKKAKFQQFLKDRKNAPLRDLGE